MTTSDEYRAQAASSFKAEADSFERCDTDGFLSQWAHNISGRKAMLDAEIADNGGMIEVSALFDLSGNLVPAKYINGQFGMVWAILADSDPNSRFIGWFNESKAQNEETARKNNAKKGYYVGTVKVPGRADIGGSGKGLSGAASCYVYAKRTDGGFSADAVIVDNGQ